MLLLGYLFLCRLFFLVLSQCRILSISIMFVVVVCGINVGTGFTRYNVMWFSFINENRWVYAHFFQKKKSNSSFFESSFFCVSFFFYYSSSFSFLFVWIISLFFFVLFPFVISHHALLVPPGWTWCPLSHFTFAFSPKPKALFSLDYYVSTFKWPRKLCENDIVVILGLRKAQWFPMVWI